LRDRIARAVVVSGRMGRSPGMHWTSLVVLLCCAGPRLDPRCACYQDDCARRRR